jgi:ATP-binding protein involved in chromosome partitioning
LHYDVPFLGAIPMNPNVRIGGDNGRPIVIADPGSDAALALKNLAETVAARVSVAALAGSNAPTIDVI